MKRNHITAAVLSLLCAAALTACGSDPIEKDTAEITTTAAETTAVTESETTGTETATTAETKETKETETSAADETTTESADETTTAAEEATTTAAEQTTEAPAQQTEAPATEAPQNEPNLFDVLKIGGSCADYVAAHKPTSRVEADSCVVVGKDIVYTYPDFILRTAVENGVEWIHDLEITGSSIQTKKGIHVGSTEAEVTAAYGAASDLGYIYNTAEGELEFEMENGVVKKIYLNSAE